MDAMVKQSRPEMLAEVRKALAKSFPNASFATNDDANPATPMVVTAKWGGGRITKVVRADSIRSSVADFVSRATSALEKFQKNAVPSQDQ